MCITLHSIKFIQTVPKPLILILPKTHSDSITKTNRLMLFREVSIFSGNHMEPLNMPCEYNVPLLISRQTVHKFTALHYKVLTNSLE